MILLHLLAFITIITGFALAITYSTLWLVKREDRVQELRAKRALQKFRRKQRDFYNF